MSGRNDFPLAGNAPSRGELGPAWGEATIRLQGSVLSLIGALDERVPLLAVGRPIHAEAILAVLAEVPDGSAVAPGVAAGERENAVFEGARKLGSTTGHVEPGEDV